MFSLHQEVPKDSRDAESYAEAGAQKSMLIILAMHSELLG